MKGSNPRKTAKQASLLQTGNCFGDNDGVDASGTTESCVFLRTRYPEARNNSTPTRREFLSLCMADWL